MYIKYTLFLSFFLMFYYLTRQIVNFAAVGLKHHKTRSWATHRSSDRFPESETNILLTTRVRDEGWLRGGGPCTY